VDGGALKKEYLILLRTFGKSEERQLWDLDGGCVLTVVEVEV
jgi:hypothetical protein